MSGYDDRCETCSHSKKQAAKHRDAADQREIRLENELDQTYAMLRAVIENCKTATPKAIRHQLVGLMPETRELDPDVRARLLASPTTAHLVPRLDAAKAKGWADYGYPTGGVS